MTDIWIVGGLDDVEGGKSMFAVTSKEFADELVAAMRQYVSDKPSPFWDGDHEGFTKQSHDEVMRLEAKWVQESPFGPYLPAGGSLLGTYKDFCTWRMIVYERKTT